MQGLLQGQQSLRVIVVVQRRPVVALRSRGQQRLSVWASAAANGTDPAYKYNVVITGSTKGVGKALAAEFIRAGDSVVVCSREGDRVNSAVEELQALAKQEGSGSKVVGIPCNVARPAEVARLADFAAEELGDINLWINNAGSNAYKYTLLAESNDDDLVNVVETNMLGVMLCCKEAIRIMRSQKADGHIFNMDGAGADGGGTPRFAAYGATKRGLEQLSKSLNSELRMLGLKNVAVHNLSPGMVTTDLLMAGADTQVAKFFINCLAERPETVAEYLVPRIRQVPQDSKAILPGMGIGKSAYIRYLTKPKAYGQILGRLFTGARKNRFVSEDQ